MIDRIKRGEAPVLPAPEPTVADLAERYVKAHLEVNCQPKMVESFGRCERFLTPEEYRRLGRVLAMAAADVLENITIAALALSHTGYGPFAAPGAPK